MLNASSHKYGDYTQQIGKLNTVADPIRSFEVLPAIAQTLREKLKGSSDSLSKINTIPVVAQEGDKVGVGVKGPIASRYEALDAWAHQPSFQTLFSNAIVGAKARARHADAAAPIKRSRRGPVTRPTARSPGAPRRPISARFPTPPPTSFWLTLRKG